MSLEAPSLLGALQSGAGAVPRRPGARRLLEDCWTPIRNAIELRFADILLETLGPLCKSEDENEARPAKQILLRDKAALQAFSESLHAEFKQAVDDFCAQRVQAKATGAPGLSLIEYDAMEFSTAMESASARIRNAADEEFTGLRIRLANLVREPEIRDIENPFRPVIFLRAIYLALERVGVYEPDLMRMTKRFDSALVTPIAAAYGAVDRHLAAQGISADMAPVALARNSGLGVPANPFGNSALGVPGNPFGNSALGVPANPFANSALGMAGNPFGNSALGMPAAPFGNSVLGSYANTRNTLMPGPMTGAATTTAPHFAPGIGVDQVLQALYQRLHLVGAPMLHGAAGIPSLGATATAQVQAVANGAATNPGPLAATPGWTIGAASAGAHGASIDPALLAAIGEAQRLDAGGLASAVPMGNADPGAALDPALLRAQVADKAAKQVDKLTIEIVGLLFDRIDQDRLVPPPIKEQLHRLQFPLIRVALTDPELFVSPQQPARGLLDRIAATSVGWVPHGEQNERYLEEVQRAVGAVLTATDESVAPFRLALDGFEAYLAEENTRDDDPVARAKRALEEAETREVHAINATIQVRQAFEGVMLESYLRDFLLDTWVRVLVAANRREAAQPGLMRHFLKLVPALVWTVQPKVNPEDKQHLARKVPAVLNALREGLALIDWPQAKSQEFFARLMNSHAQAVKALELAHGVTQPFVPSTLGIKLAGITMSADRVPADEQGGELPVSDSAVAQLLAANRLAVNHLSAPDDQEAGQDIELDRHIASFRRGDWFDLRRGNTSDRVQLRWLSPRRAIYLFATAQDEQIYSMKPATLRALMHEGRLAPVEAEQIFERALRATMDALEHAAGEATNVGLAR
jgi:Protein of unknown function (DUF1631)